MIKVKSKLLLLFLVLSLNGFTQKPADKRLAGLDTTVARILKDWKAPGVSIAVVDKNKVVYTGGFGYRDVEKKLPVTDNTLFAIGSCTKAFTASMLGILVKEGRIDLDKPVRDYLPELKFFNDQLNNQVTLRDMICHRTGLPRHDYEGKEILPADYVRDAMTNQMATCGLPSMENPVIQGIGYGLAWGLASYRGHYRVEHGGGIDGFISTTGFFPTDSIGIYVVSCSGQVTSAVRNWIADRMLGLTYMDWHKQSRDAFVKGRFTALMTPRPNDSLGRVFNTKPSLPLQDYAGKYTHKGYGSMEVTLVNNQLRAQYNGTSFPLKHKHFDVFRGKPEGPQYEDGTDTELFFALSKEGKVKSVASSLQSGLADIVFEKELIASPLTRADLEKYAGEYLLGPQQVTFVIRNNTTLFALLPPQPDYELVPSGKDEFKLRIMDGFSVKFKLDDHGKAIEAVFVQPNGMFTAKRKE